MINPKQVKSFLTVVELGSVNAAAEELCLAPSSVSAQLKALAGVLGISLFETSGRGVIVTPNARKLIPRFEQLLALNSDVIAEAQSMLGDLAGELRLYAPSSMCIYRLPPLIEALQKAAPSIELHLQHDPLDYHKALADRSIEAAIVVYDFAEADYESVRIASEQIIYVTHPDLKVNKKVSLKYLTEQALITTEPGCSYRTMAEDHFKQNSLRLTPRQSFSNVEVIRRCLLAKMGIGLLPRCVVDDDLEQGLLVEQPVSGMPYRCSSKIIWPKDCSVSPRLDALLDVIKAQNTTE